MKKLLYLIVILFSVQAIGLAENPTEGDHKKESFNPGTFIMEHIADSHDWHIMDIGDHPVSIPLPVILYSNEQGFKMFMSSKFEHGHASFSGFEIAHEGDFKGKVVETLADGSQVVPLDLSITKNVVAIWVSMIIIILIFVSIANAYKRSPGKAPKGLQSLIEPLIIFVRDDIVKASIGEKKYERFVPYMLTLFFFIFINNLLGLIPFFPFGANVTGNIAVTLLLAIVTFTITTVKGNKDYWLHIFWTPGVPWWLKLPVPLMFIVEFSGIFIKPFVLMIRLFANITAGHIIALGFFSLIFIFGDLYGTVAGLAVSPISVAFVIFMTLLELLVAFIQAYVFTLLSSIYISMAMEEHHENAH